MEVDVFIIGLAGGIGSGKSEVARIMSELGAVVLDADRVGHGVYAPNTEGWAEVVGTFGEDILDESGNVDRRKLGAKVFGNPGEMEKLNAIAWPKIRGSIEDKIEEERQRGSSVVVVDAAILIEAGWTNLGDEVWVTIAPETDVVNRLRVRNNLSEEDVMVRISSQMTAEERVRHADAVIDNNGDLGALKEKVELLWVERVSNVK
jgi:dephospho-CoA kinase